MTDLADLTYGELLDHLRKDLQLDARTDLQPGTVLQSLVDKNGYAAFPQIAPLGSSRKTWITGGSSAFVGTGVNPQTITFTYPTAPLPNSPSLFLVSPAFWGPGTLIPVSGPTATSVSLQAWASGGVFTNLTTYYFYWLAAIL